MESLSKKVGDSKDDWKNPNSTIKIYKSISYKFIPKNNNLINNSNYSLNLSEQVDEHIVYKVMRGTMYKYNVSKKKYVVYKKK